MAPTTHEIPNAGVCGAHFVLTLIDHTGSFRDVVYAATRIF